jgi:hypothetical protein
VATLTTDEDVRSYLCRSKESAIKLAERFIAGVTKPARPAAQAETTRRPLPNRWRRKPISLAPGRGFFLLANNQPVTPNLSPSPGRVHDRS